MRAVVQRVSSASVSVDDQTIGSIGRGLMVLICVVNDDTEGDLDLMVRKISNMRIFDDDEGVMNRSVIDVEGNVLAISQFTLAASVKKGNRPSYIAAAGHDKAVPMYEEFCRRMSQAIGRPVETGRFGADMKVALVNDGPVTIIVDTKNM